MSHINTLITTFRNLFTTPVTVKAVAEKALLAVKPEKLMNSPSAHDNAADTNVTWTWPSKCSSESCRRPAAKSSPYSPVMTTQNGGAIIKLASKLLWKTKKPQVVMKAEVGDNVFDAYGNKLIR